MAKRTGITYNELAITILKEAGKPLTSGEIWGQAVSKGLDKKIGNNGKTPRNTLSSILGNSRGTRSQQIRHTNTSPRKYYLRDPKE